MSRGTRVYLGRLPRDTRERDVEKFIRGYGQYREISIKLGYGFVVSSIVHADDFLQQSAFLNSFLHLLQEFYDSKDADDCVYDLNGKEILGER